MSGILDMTALELGTAIKKREISSVEATQAQLKKIHEQDGEINAYIHVLDTQALLRAEEIDNQIARGALEAAPLAGVPMALKDNLCLKGVPATCASRMLEHFVPAYDATAVKLLKDQGLVFVGKTNMDEFAMGSTTETSYFGPTKNPVNKAYVPGGSSGGSAAALAASEAMLALGSDTGGSIRQPSSYCGVVGMKPTYGTVSRFGLIAYGSSLDQIGPMARSVKDCAALMECIAAYDAQDSTSVELSGETRAYSSMLEKGVKGMHIGLPMGYFGEGLDPEVKKAVLDAAAVLEREGAIIEEFKLPMTDYVIPAYYVLASAEASSNLSRFDGVRYGYRTEHYENLQELYKKSRSEGFGREVKRRMLIGAFVLSSGYYDAYYNKALKIKAMIRQSFDEAFKHFDMILGPTAPSTAPKLGESLEDPLKMYLGDIYTVAVNLAGLPGISVPCGTDSKGLPIGVQLIGSAFSEKKLFAAAYAYEQNFKTSLKSGSKQSLYGRKEAH